MRRLTTVDLAQFIHTECAISKASQGVLQMFRSLSQIAVFQMALDGHSAGESGGVAHGGPDNAKQGGSKKR